jgi:hypothetical protein
MAFALTALTTLPDEVLLGPGYLFVGNTHLAISRGGLSFEPQVEMRNIPYDGKHADVAELDWITFSGAVISGTFLTRFIRSTTFEAGSVSSDPGGNIETLITPQAAGELLGSGEYLTNVRLYFPDTGWQIRFPKAICPSYSIQTEDRGEGLLTATFAARLPLSTAAGSSPGTRPYVIEQLAAFS